MANMAVSRIKREFKEVMRSEEVSPTIANIWIHGKGSIIFIIG